MRFKEFSGEWGKTRLKNIVSIHARIGWHGLRQEEFLNNGDYYLITGTDIINGKLNYNNIKFIDKQRYDQDVNIQIKDGDILITKDGTIGKVALVNKIDKKATLNAGVYRIRNNEVKIDNIYLYHYLKAPFLLKFAKKESTGGTIKHLNQSQITNMEIPFASIKEQQKIATFLTLIDKRIETQMKIIEEYKSLMNSIVIRIFGNKSKFSNIWKKTKLSEVLTERKLYAQKDSEFTHVTLSKDGIIDKTDRYNRDFLVKDEEKEYKITKLNDICYNPANLKFGVICLNKYGDAIFSPIYVTFEINKNYNPHFIELALTNATFIRHIRKYEQGTVYERMAVSSEDFLKGYIWMPQKDEQDQIVSIINKIDNIIHVEEKLFNNYKLQKKHLLNNMFI